MRIAQIAPLAESVPPKLYGGTERVVAWLTDELVAMGHDVTLFASGDSVTCAHLEPCSHAALRLDPTTSDPLPHAVLQIEKVRQQAGRFDILHFHTDHIHLPVIRSFGDRTLTTLHGRLDTPDVLPLFREFDDVPLVSISDDQRKPLPPVNWLGTVYHGLPRDLYRGAPRAHGGYLAFLGRISVEKRPDLAIDIALRADVPLKIFAKIDDADEEYFRAEIEPLLKHPLVEFVGEIGEEAKQQVLGDARALLFPIDWPEPFGLVMIEAMACGTPVIAFRRGSVPEVIDEGLTGYIVDDVEQAVAAVGRINELDRTAIRRRFEDRFTAERMARDYEKLYRQLCDLEVQQRRAVSLQAPAARRLRHVPASPRRPATRLPEELTDLS